MTPRQQPTGADGDARERLAALEARFAAGEIETVIDRSGVSGCGTGGHRAVTVRHRPTGRVATATGNDTQVANKIAALVALLDQLQAGMTDRDSERHRAR